MAQADASERFADHRSPIRKRLDAVSVILAIVVAWIGTVVAFVAFWSTSATIWTAALGPDIFQLAHTPFSFLLTDIAAALMTGVTLASAILVGRVLGDPAAIVRDRCLRHWGSVGVASAVAIVVGTVAGFEAIAAPLARQIATDGNCAVLYCGPLIVAISLGSGLIAQVVVLGAIRVWRHRSGGTDTAL